MLGSSAIMKASSRLSEQLRHSIHGPTCCDENANDPPPRWRLSISKRSASSHAAFQVGGTVTPTASARGRSTGSKDRCMEARALSLQGMYTKVVPRGRSPHALTLNLRPEGGLRGHNKPHKKQNRGQGGPMALWAPKWLQNPRRMTQLCISRGSLGHVWPHFPNLAPSLLAILAIFQIATLVFWGVGRRGSKKRPCCAANYHLGQLSRTVGEFWAPGSHVGQKQDPYRSPWTIAPMKLREVQTGDAATARTNDRKQRHKVESQHRMEKALPDLRTTTNEDATSAIDPSWMWLLPQSRTSSNYPRLSENMPREPWRGPRRTAHYG